MNQSKYTLQEIDQLLGKTAKIVADYNAALTFVDGIATYKNEAISENCACFVQRRAGLADTGFAFSTHNEVGVLKVFGPSDLNVTLNVNILIFPE